MQTNGQEQQQEQTQTYAAAPSGDLAAAPVLNPPDSATTADSAAAQAAQIEAYLDAVCLQMPAEVPAVALENMRLEMRGHLEAAIVAHCELGQTKAEATQSALVQFGPPKMVAQQWQQEWTKTLSETQISPSWSSLETAFRTWTIANVTALALIAIYTFLNEITTTASPVFRLTHKLLIFTILFGAPMVAGITIGSRVRRHAVFCTLIGSLVTSPIMAAGLVAMRCCPLWYSAWLTHKASPDFSMEFRGGIGEMGSILPLWVIASLLLCGVVVCRRHIRKRVRRRQIAR